MLFSLFTGHQRQRERMQAMTQRLGVDVVALAEAGFGRDLDAASAECRRCRAVGTCQSWLDGSTPGANPYAFCPNSALFDEHRRS